VDLQDFQLKYANTVLVIHVYVRLHQDVTKLQKSVIRAAKGPRLDALAMWTEICDPDQELGPEAEKFGEDRAQVEEFLRASKDGVLVLHLCVNTDSDPQRVGENVQRAARGPRFDDVMCVIVQYDGDDGRKIWDLVQKTVRQAVADPAAKPFSL
jgi:hypothetical protein